MPLMFLLRTDINMQTEEQVFSRRLKELSERCRYRQIPTFSDFLDLNEQNIFHCFLSRGVFEGTPWKLYGGYELAERQMLAFLPDALSCMDENDIPFPFQCLKISPVNLRFADPLTHRDYLGSLLNLGIDRSRVGDILPGPEETFVFCHDTVADLIMNELIRVRHTQVQVQPAAEGTISWKPNLRTIRGSVASPRLDALLSLAFSVSRSRITALIPEGKVFVNGRLVTSPGFTPSAGDLVSVRGHGRFRYDGVITESRKGRQIVTLQKYE